MRILFALFLMFCIAASSSSQEADTPKDSVIKVVYPVAESPVWTADGKFKPDFLIKLITDSIKTKEAKEKQALEIRAFPSEAVIIVKASISDQERIWESMKRLPGIVEANGLEKPDFEAIYNRRFIRVSDSIRNQSKQHEIELLEKLWRRSSIEGWTNPTPSHRAPWDRSGIPSGVQWRFPAP